MATKIPSYNGHLTKNFGYQEMIKSSTADRLGISNDASREHVINLTNLCNFILQPVREEFGVIRINSGYRSPALNKAVGGSKTSQHCNGQAADFESTRISNPNLAKWIEKNLIFDQLILEFYDGVDPNSGWVHCSYVLDGSNRSKTMTALRVNGKTQYKDRPSYIGVNMKYVWLFYLQILFVIGANRGRSWVDNHILLCYNSLDKLNVNYVKYIDHP